MSHSGYIAFKFKVLSITEKGSYTLSILNASELAGIGSILVCLVYMKITIMQSSLLQIWVYRLQHGVEKPVCFTDKNNNNFQYHLKSES